MAAIVLMLGLALTSRRKKMQAKESVLFAADGFGYTKDVKRWADTDIVTVPWKDVRAVLIERKGSQWYRLRIGSYRSSRLVNVRL
ncbi:MAG: hypothetical protein FWC56_02850, partial [Phycisphaerae bacterium]|nr:hypothetical protein [Phycisphaerae bacterium]